MTIVGAITKLDNLIPNTFTMEEKIEWLSHVDGVIRDTVVDLCEGRPKEDFEGYREDTPPDTVLLVVAPFDELYLRWMEAQIHYYNGEMDRYNNAIILYKDLLEGYKSHYMRKHKLLSSVGGRFLF